MKTVVACDVFLGQDHLMRSGSMSRRNAIMTLGWGSLWVVQIERVNVCIVTHWALVSTKYNSANDIWCKEYIRLLARIAQMTRYILSANANALALADMVHTCDIFVGAFFYIFFVATTCRRASCAHSIRCLMGENLRSMACASQSSLRCEITLATHGSNGSVDVSVACQSQGTRSLLRNRMAAQTMRALSEVCS